MPLTPSHQCFPLSTVRPKKWDGPQVGFGPFGVAMLLVGALCFYQGHFGRTVLPKWPLWEYLFYSVFYGVTELERVCFRQARVARAMLPSDALFRAGAFTLPPLPPNPTSPHVAAPTSGLSPKHRDANGRHIAIQMMIMWSLFPLSSSRQMGWCAAMLWS